MAGQLQFQPAKRNPNYSAARNRILRERWEKPERVIDRIQLDHRPPLLLPAKMLPLRLTGLQLGSIDKVRPSIRLKAVLPEHGIPINPRIGDYGGFDLGFTVDGGGDRKSGDADATVFLRIRAAKEIDSNQGLDGISWQLETPQGGTRLKISDFSAFGLKAPDEDKDGVQDFADNCPIKANPKQSDKNRNGIGDACDGER